MNKNSFSYKKGFVKGIEIYSENLSNSGYYADANNKRTMENCKKYAESGYKNQIRLTDKHGRRYFEILQYSEAQHQGGVPGLQSDIPQPLYRRIQKSSMS